MYVSCMEVKKSYRSPLCPSLGLEIELGLSGTAASSPLPTEPLCEPINIPVIKIITVCLQTLVLNHFLQINV